MPPIPPVTTRHTSLDLRAAPPQEADRGVNFTIILASITGTIVLCCVLWALVPQIRKRFPPKPSRTKFNDGSVLPARTLRSRVPDNRPRAHTFPIHPAVSLPEPLKPVPRLVSRPKPVRTYDPRTETPFPSSPLQGEPVKLPAIFTPCPASVVDTIPSTSSHGLFSPRVIRSRLTARATNPEYHTVPKVSNSSRSHHCPAPSTDFGDAKQYILAVPEPLSLRTKLEAEPEAMLQSTQYQQPITLSSSMARPIHPNKLFRTLKAQEMRSSECSSTSLRLDHRVSDAAALATTTKDVLTLIDTAIDKKDIEKSPALDSGNADSSLDLNDLSIRGVELSDSPVLHRLESYKSLTGGQRPILTRAGTVTRPKTPVYDMLKAFDVQSTGSNLVPANASSIPHLDTKSTIHPRTNSSEIGSISTPHTSPEHSVSKLEMLPTPLQIKRTAMVLPAHISLSENQSQVKPRSIAELRREAEKTRQRHKETAKYLKQHANRSLQHNTRHRRPAPLKMKPTTDFKVSAIHKQIQRKSFTSFRHSLSSPLIKSNFLRSSIPRSSVYSRDTWGFSIVKTPLSAAFPSPSIESPAGGFVTRDLSSLSQPGRPVNTTLKELDQRTRPSSTASFLTLKDTLSKPSAKTGGQQFARTGTSCETGLATENATSPKEKHEANSITLSSKVTA